MKKIFVFVLTITMLLCSGWSSNFYLASDEKDTEIEPELYIGGSCWAAVTEAGNLYMWGYNASGQIGNGDKAQQLTPEKVLDNVISSSLGYFHSGAITENGDLYMWGDNEHGQIGIATTEDQLTPIKVLNKVVAIALDGYHSSAITEDGSLYMWGHNEHGQVGNGTTEDQLTPVKVLDNVVATAIGYSHNGAITEDGSLYMWGENLYGAVGNGTTEDQLTPVKVLDNVVSVALGDSHSAAVTEDGSLYVWGYNASGQVGNGTEENQLTPIKVLEKVTSVALGWSYSGAITENGDLYMWGANREGGVGNGTTEDQLVPTKVLQDVKEVFLKNRYSGAITENGSLYMWGKNNHGQIGNGTTEDQLIPEKVMDNIITVAVTFDVSEGAATGAIAEDGGLYTWGNNNDAFLGNGSATGLQTIPLKIFDVKSDFMEDSIIQIENAQEGDIIELDIEDSCILPQEVLEAMQGKDVTLKIVLNDGTIWSINGTDVTAEELADIDLSVERTTDGNILEEVISNLAGDRFTEQLVFAEEGAFAFPLQLTITPSVDVNNEKVVLIQNVDNTLQLADSVLIANDSITFDLTNMADSVIVYGTNGDTNGDDSVTIKDTMQMLHHISNRSELNEVQKGFADVDMSDTVNLQDLMREMRYVSGRTDSLYETE